MDQEMPLELWAIYHAPCSPRCRASIRLGEEYLSSVKRLSEKLYREVLHGLSSAHLAFSVRRRFINFKEMKTDIKSELRKLAQRLLPSPIHFTGGTILRPFSYFRWERGAYKLLITPSLQGKKIIAFSPGNGVLIVDENLRIYVYTRRDLLGAGGLKFSSTAFRMYRSKKP